MFHGLPYLSKRSLRYLTLLPCAAFVSLLGCVLAAAAHAEDAEKEKPLSKPLGPKDGLVVVSPDSFWFKFPEDKGIASSPEQEEGATKEAEEQARQQAEEKARQEAEEQAQRQAAEEQARQKERVRKRTTHEERVAQGAEDRKPPGVRDAEIAAGECLATQAETPAGQTRTFCDISFAWIPAGAFDMGSSLSAEDVALIFGGDSEQYRDEQPSHTVTLTKGFWIGVHEVTNAQFEAFVTATGYATDAEREGWGRVWNGAQWENRQGAAWRNPGWSPEPDLPVVLTSWNDGTAYAEWLSTRGDGHFRLPAETEWEYACRAGSMSAFSFGNDASLAGGYARYRGNALAAGEPCPAAVGSMKPNDWGLYDMHGNVSEWCQDWYDETYYAQSPAIDPQGPASGECRSLRGGSWYSLPCFLRSACRTRAISSYRYVVLGLRVCRDG